MRKLYLTIAVAGIFSSINVKSQPISKIDIFNSVIDSLYEISLCTKFKNVSVAEADSLELIMIVNDSLTKFDLADNKQYLLSKVKANSEFYNFIKGINTRIQSGPYRYDSLKQGAVRFVTIETFNKEGRKHRFGKSGNQLLIGYFSLSSILFNKTKAIGIFKSDYLGGGTCGYNSYILIYKNSGVWKIYKKIISGVY